MSSPQYLVGGYLVSRRRFVAALGAGWATATVTAAGAAVAQQQQSAASNVPMNQDAAKTVRRPPKPGAAAVVSDEERDALEHQIKCQCSCTLDVYTCRTTDFSCQVSPAMHRDVISLVEGGYTADEIITAFNDTYGQQVLMAPRREGFNLAGYAMPFAALGTGAVVVATLIRKWGRRAALVHAQEAAVRGRSASTNGAQPDGLDASPEELARLEAAVRGEGA